jgi:hypothetical protein
LVKSWLKKELLSYIDKTFIEKQNIFYFETVSTLVNNHFKEKLIIHLESGHSIVFKNGINKRMKSKNKLIRITTVPISLEKLLENQLLFMKTHFEVTNFI